MADNTTLLNMAERAMQNAYAPYSKFRVGAALLTSDGSIYTGCNIENLSYGAAICAERCAVSKAVSDGKRDFVKIAIVSSGGELTYPCGICRQVLSEFANDMEIILKDKNNIYTYKLSELLPHSFYNKF